MMVNVSPASGTPPIPRISTGIDGPALSIFSPLSLIKALILPLWRPTTKWFPTLSVPSLTSIVPIGPLPLSSFASITTPLAGFSGFAFSSRISDWISIISRSSFKFSFFFADTLTKITSPPRFSGTRPLSISSFLTFSVFASGLSILLMATMIGTSAELAWLMASTVCGITPSSAATTSTTISVTRAPLALMVVNASCPGVSMKTIFLLSILTSYAPMCCVIPPNSSSTTFVSLMASRRVVFPWSTCPIIVTTGGLRTRFPSVSSTSFIKSSSSTAIFFTSYPNS